MGRFPPNGTMTLNGNETGYHSWLLQLTGDGFESVNCVSYQSISIFARPPLVSHAMVRCGAPGCHLRSSRQRSSMCLVKHNAGSFSLLAAEGVFSLDHWHQKSYSAAWPVRGVSGG